jgi:tetratricopeptide (TPR) repeat protein
LYLALPAIVAAFVQAGAIWFDRTASARGTILSAAVCAAIVLAALSFRQTFFWRDSLSLWQRQVSESPGECQGQGFLAEVLRQNSPDALEHARIAERLAPDRGSTHARLGTIYAAMGNRDEAIAQFTLATQCRPPAIIAYVSLGELAAKAGNDADAAQHYRDAIAVARTYFHWPGYPPAEANLGQLYFRDGRVAEAIELFNSAIAQEPQMVEAQNNLGIALMSQHHYAEAIPHLREALRQRPGLTKTQALLDEAIARAGSGTGGP